MRDKRSKSIEEQIEDAKMQFHLFSVLALIMLLVGASFLTVFELFPSSDRYCCSIHDSSAMNSFPFFMVMIFGAILLSLGSLSYGAWKHLILKREVDLLRGDIIYD